MVMSLGERLADRGSWNADNCSIAKAIAVVGSRTSMLFVREAFYGTTRFVDFVERVGVTDAVASTHLKRLVDAGVLERRPYREPGSRTRYAYYLTEMGEALLPILVSLMQWGDRYLQPDGAPLQIRESHSGREVSVAVRDGDGREVKGPDLTVVVNEDRRTGAGRNSS